MALWVVEAIDSYSFSFLSTLFSDTTVLLHSLYSRNLTYEVAFNVVLFYQLRKQSLFDLHISPMKPRYQCKNLDLDKFIDHVMEWICKSSILANLAINLTEFYLDLPSVKSCCSWKYIPLSIKNNSFCLATNYGIYFHL